MEGESTSSVSNNKPVAELNNTNSTHDVSNISITSVRQLDINEADCDKSTFGEG